MGLVIEMLGAPGAGKTTMMRAIEEACRANDRLVFTTGTGAREFARRTTLGRAAWWFTPSHLRSRVLWAVYRVLSGWHTFRFAWANRDLTRYIIRSQRARSVDSDALQRRVLYWYLRTMGSYRYLVSLSRPGEVVVLDEGFVHRVVQLHTSTSEAPQPSQIAAYIGLLHPPDLVVYIEAPLPVCQQRLRDRGVWDRLAHRHPHEIDQFVSNAHGAVRLARDEIGRRGWRVIDVDNSGDNEAAVAMLDNGLRATLFADDRVVEGQPG